MATLTNRAAYAQRYDTYMNTPSDLLTSDLLHFIEVWNHVLALEAYAAAREATIAELTASRDAIATRLVAAGVEIGMLQNQRRAHNEQAYNWGAQAGDLKFALEELLERYVGLIASGDCGFWEAEEEVQVIRARRVLAMLRDE